MNGEKNKPAVELTDDELMSGDAAAIRKRIDEMVEQKVRQSREVPDERRKLVEDAKKEFAVFADDDEETREISAALMDRAVAELPADADAEQFKKAAEQVSKKIAKIRTAAQPDEQEQKKVPSPVPVEGGSAAATHLEDAPPKNVADAEALADKIAREFKTK